MYIYNITFVTSHDKEYELLDYLKKYLLPLLFNPQSPAANPELRKVVEIASEKPDADHGVSIALSVSFASEVSAHSWHDTSLLPALEEFNQRFGSRALYFLTLLQSLPLDA